MLSVQNHQRNRLVCTAIPTSSLDHLQYCRIQLQGDLVTYGDVSVDRGWTCGGVCPWRIWGLFFWRPSEDRRLELHKPALVMFIVQVTGDRSMWNHYGQAPPTMSLPSGLDYLMSLHTCMTRFPRPNHMLQVIKDQRWQRPGDKADLGTRLPKKCVAREWYSSFAVWHRECGNNDHHIFWLRYVTTSSSHYT